MKLHTAGKEADWQAIKPSRRNAWQSMAAGTNGWLTPANLLSLVGLLLVIASAYVIIHHDYVAGFITLILGRMADLLDGLVADKTGTKSPLGELVDVACDKLALAIILPVLALQPLVPLTVLLIIMVQNIIVGTISLLAKIRGIRLHPNRDGKLAVAASWATIIAFSLASTLPENKWELLRAASLVVAITTFAVFVILGFSACIKYARDFSRRQEVPKSATAHFERIIIIMNPASSHAKRVRTRIRELQKLFPNKEMEVVETSKVPEQFRARLIKELQAKPETTLLCIGGGDGTVHTVLNILMNARADLKLKNIVLLPLWGGNANDFAYMLNGQSLRTKLQALFSEAHIVAVHPFEIIQKSSGRETSKRYAACYASFGASAYAADKLDKTSGRKKLVNKSPASRFVSEFIRTGKALLDAPGFDIELKGERVKIFEHVFINGSRMAKFDRLPLKLNEKKFYSALRPEQEPIFLFYMRLLKIFHRKDRSGMTSQPQSFVLEDKTWAQFDGEAMTLPAKTKITIKHAKTPFYVLSKKLNSTQ